MRMRSLKRTRCGLVKAWTLWPLASSAARRKATVEPLPLVPATWKTGEAGPADGRAGRAQRDPLQPEPVAGGREHRQPVELRLDAGMRRAREVGHQAASLRLRREIGDQQRELLLQVAARNDHVDDAVLEQIFGALESLGQLLADGLLDHPLAGEADQRARLGDLDVAEHRVGGGDAAGRRIGEDDDIGQARLPSALRARPSSAASASASGSPSCIRAPPAAVKMMYGQRSAIAARTPATNAAPTAVPIEPPMKAKSCTPTIAVWPSILPRALTSASRSPLAARALFSRSV